MNRRAIVALPMLQLIAARALGARDVPSTAIRPRALRAEFGPIASGNGHPHTAVMLRTRSTDTRREDQRLQLEEHDY